MRGIEIEKESWMAVGEYLRQAIFEVASSIGGENTVEQAIQLAGDPNALLPDPKAIKFLKTKSPTAPEEIISRAEEIQKIRLRSEKNKFKL